MNCERVLMWSDFWQALLFTGGIFAIAGIITLIMFKLLWRMSDE